MFLEYAVSSKYWKYIPLKISSTLFQWVPANTHTASMLVVTLLAVTLLAVTLWRLNLSQCQNVTRSPMYIFVSLCDKDLAGHISSVCDQNMWFSCNRNVSRHISLPVWLKCVSPLLLKCVAHNSISLWPKCTILVSVVNEQKK